MKMTLAENIRKFRKERSLTQEQLSEALGVTPGAVYKWEAKLSIPELELILQMADFFDTSVDALLGYEMKDNGLDATVKRLQEYRRRKDRAGLAEAEKALKKYPHSFPIVNASAALYHAFGIESGDKALFRRALELLAPLDPLLWDKELIRALWDFRYSWEIYTPAAKRSYGAYTLPILYGERFVGRIDAAADRKSGALCVKGLWWEPGVRQTKTLQTALEQCLCRFCRFNDCERVVRDA